MMLNLQRLWIQLTANKRKFGGLCLAVIVLLLLWARLILVSNSPRMALAERTPAGSGEPQGQESGRSDKSQIAPLPVSLPSNPVQDPFIISDEHFPELPLVPDLPPDQGKSDLQPAEDPEEVEARFRAELRSLVDQLTLDAVMSSAGLAIISGQTYGTGDKVPAPTRVEIQFTLREMGQRSVTLEFEGRRFEMKMSNPGA